MSFASKLLICRKYASTISRTFSINLAKHPNIQNHYHKSILYFCPSVTRLDFLDNNRKFKTWSLNFSEESDSVETKEEDKKPDIHPRKDRTQIIPPETSMRYMKSAAYKETYGDEPVWVKYRRNFKGQFIPKKTRKTCIRGGVISCGNPCPICRDIYLVLDYRNVDLLKQFISPYTGKILELEKIHLCQKKLFQLEVEVQKAKFYGYLTYDVPFRRFDYKDYYPMWRE